MCGIAGLKPTSGRVPGTGHITPPGFGVIGAFTQIGPMARYVEDLKLCLPVIAGPDGRDPAVVPVALRDADDVELKMLRILAFTDNGVLAPDAETSETIVAVAAALEPCVARVEFRCPPLLAEGTQLFVRLYEADGGASIKRLLTACGTQKPTAALASIIAAAQPIDGGEFSAILEQISLWRTRMLSLLDDYDAILCPVLPCAAQLHDTAYVDRYLEWSHAMVYNIAGWPAGVVRAGENSAGLPLGVQIAAGPWREDIVLALAASVEAHTGGYSAPSV